MENNGLLDRFFKWLNYNGPEQKRHLLMKFICLHLVIDVSKKLSGNFRVTNENISVYVLVAKQQDLVIFCHILTIAGKTTKCMTR